MRTLRLTVAYDGTAYAGWQLQKGQVSVQQRMEEAWLKITGEQIRIIASGRTDAGVHARGQVCSLRTATELEPEILARALSANLPHDIVVDDVRPAPEGFHAIRDAVCKTYQFRIVAGHARDVFENRRAWFIPERLDLAAMQQAAAVLRGRHDFASFQAAGSLRQSTVRNVLRLDLEGRLQHGRQYLTLEIAADGFLYNMVRIIAGSLSLVGRGVRDLEWIRRSLTAADRLSAGPTAPAHGLCLVSVCYDGACACWAGECIGRNLPRPPPGRSGGPVDGEDPADGADG